MRIVRIALLAVSAIAAAGCASDEPDALRGFLASSRWQERAYAAQSLPSGELTPEDRDRLRDLVFDDPEGAVRKAALLALDRSGDERALSLLVTTLRDPEEWIDVRIAAALALSRHSREVAAKALRDCLRDSEGPLADACALAIREGFDEDPARPGNVAKIAPRVELPGVAPPAAARRASGALIAILALMAVAGVAAAARATWRRGEREDEWLLVLVAIGASFVFFSPGVVEDNLSYLAYARSLAVDPDFHIADEYFVRNASLAYAPDPRGPYGPTGAAVFWTPLFAPLALVPASSPLRASFSLPVLMAVQAAATGMVCAAWVMAHRMARRRVSRFAAMAGVLAAGFGTNVLLVQYGWTGSTHAPAVFLATLFLYLLDQRPADVWRWLLCGLAAGLLTQTRFQGALFVPLAAAIWLLGIRERGRDLATAVVQPADWTNGMAFAGGALAGFLPQVLVWRILDGHTVSDVYQVGSGRMGFDLWRLVPLLFGGSRGESGPLVFVATGLFTAMPLLALSLVGLVRLARKETVAPLLWAVATLLQVGVLLSYPVWWGRMLFATPYLGILFASGAVGLAVAVDVVEKRGPRARVALAIVLVAGCLPSLRAVMIEAARRANPADVRVESFPDLVAGAVLLPDLVFRDDGLILRQGNVGLPLRSVAEALRDLDVLRLALWALGYAAVFAGARIAVAGSRRLPIRPAAAAAGCLLVLLAGFSVVATRKGLVTDLELDHFVLSKPAGPGIRALVEVDALRPTGEIRFDGRRADRVEMVFVARGIRDLPQGAAVLDVTLDLHGGGQVVRTLHAGVELADVERLNPSLTTPPAHGAGSDPVQERIVRDHATRSYPAHAWRTTFDLPDGAILERVRFENSATGASVWLTHVLVTADPPGWRHTRAGRWIP